MKARLARAALALYPLAFRHRYANEMEALLEQGPPRLRDVLDLVRGACLAHLRSPHGAEELVPAADRVRASASGVLLCWVLLVAAGFGFYKTTEDTPFSAAGHAHPLLAGSHVAVQVGATIGSIAVLAGALPLIAIAVAHALTGRSVGRLVVRPLLPVLVFVVLSAIMIALAHANAGRSGPTTPGSAAVVLWGIAGLVCGVACVSACRASLFELQVPPRWLRFALKSGAVVVGSMVVVALATALYAMAMLLDAGSLAGQGNGPFQVLSVGSSLVIQAVVMIALCALALLAIARGLRRARGLESEAGYR
jgi:hypothetical protein